MKIWIIDESNISSRTVFNAKNKFAALQKQFGLPDADIKWFSLSEAPDAQEDTINDQCELIPMHSQLKINRNEHGDLLGFTIYLHENLGLESVLTEVEMEAKKLWVYVRARREEKEMQRLQERKAAPQRDK